MKKRRSLALTDAQLDWLAREAGRLQITVSELLRRIIDRWREKA